MTLMQFFKRHKFLIHFTYTGKGLKYLGTNHVMGYFSSLQEAQTSANEMDWTTFKVVSVKRKSDRIYMFPFVKTIREIKYKLILLKRKNYQKFVLEHN